MGLFGRDDRSQATTKPENPSPVTRPATTPAPVSSETTLIAGSTAIEGTIRGSGDIRIEGRITGTVDVSGRLLIAESGRAKARLHARTVVVSGTVEGDVTADERIELQASATLTGNIVAPAIQIQEGATFEGEVRMAKPDRPAGGKTRPKDPDGDEKNQPTTSSARRPGQKNGKS